MQIFSARQIHDWDAYTIQHEPITSLELMERAALCCTNWLLQKGLENKTIKIFCGKGNNGGDGLAIARQLLEKDVDCKVYILEFGGLGTDDFQSNLHRLHQHTKEIHFIQGEEFFPVIENDDLVIDALYGSGLNRPLTGLSEALVKHINKSDATIVSIDLPSGMFADTSSKGGTVINASHSLTFQTIKLCFLLPENDAFVGDLHVLNIGLHNGLLSEATSPFNFVDEEVIRNIYKPRNKFSHKGTFGHCLLIAGSEGKMGAAILASKACLRSGAGLITSLITKHGVTIMQTALPEAMALSSDKFNEINWESYAAVGIGPGLSTDAEATALLWKVIEASIKPMVIDADALNVFSHHKDKLKLIPTGSILTPHPKEFARLFGSYDNDFDRLQGALENAKQLQCYILIKGHYSFIACPDGQGYFNSTGNAGMATAGSGDVLTGIITGLLSQGYSSRDAALLGVYLHGLAGDVAADIISQEALIASDIIKGLGKAFKIIAKY